MSVLAEMIRARNELDEAIARELATCEPMSSEEWAEVGRLLEANRQATRRRSGGKRRVTFQ